MKTRILQEFLNSNSTIKSKEKLKQYIEYCIENNTKERILNKEGVSKTSYHHILPKSLFPEYSNLKENPWNGIHLLYSKHYIAHYLLTEAIDSYSVLSAFISMHNKDTKNNRITEKDLIPPKEFQEKMEDRSKKYRKWCNEEVILKDGSISTNIKELSKKQSSTKNKLDWKETIGKKSREKWLDKVQKEFIDKNGEITTIAILGAKKAAKTMSALQEDGLTIRAKATKKRLDTFNKEYLDKNGEITTIAKEAGKKLKILKLKKVDGIRCLKTKK